ncbi:NADP-dependent oxidoreductase domain [Aspergillus oryzae]|uniref:NADP-dependent oxidoreductase domain n=1 Tax=Aspergillus oryzae TaxID=5062 RepID=A0A1S9DK58_ASPOZ|nr:NADP-dependent oxidoreductase domain [Aspergillus oryzae]
MPLPVHPPPRSPLDRHRQLAPSASVRVSPLCLGAMNFGDAWKDNLGNAQRKRHSQFSIISSITQRQNRDQLVLASKFSSSYKSHESDKLQSTYGGNGGKSMRVSLELSLQKLQTSYIHLFYLHCGKVIYLGISDYPAWVVAKANQYVRDHGLRQFSVYQGRFLRGFEREILLMYRDENMGVVPVQGKGAEQSRAQRKTPSDGEKSVSKVLETIANSKQTDLTSIDLAYVRHKAPYVFPVVGGRKVEHLRGNIAALDLSLSVEEMAQIEAAYPFDHGFPHTFLSGTLFDGSTPRTPDGPGACG